jgi:hypothetical protein
MSSPVITCQDRESEGENGEGDVSGALVATCRHLSSPVNGATSGIRTPNPRFTKAVPETPRQRTSRDLHPTPADLLSRLLRAGDRPQPASLPPTLRTSLTRVDLSPQVYLPHPHSGFSLPCAHYASAPATHQQDRDYPLGPRISCATMAPAFMWTFTVADGIRVLTNCPQIALKTRHEMVRNRVGTAHQRDDGTPLSSEDLRRKLSCVHNLQKRPRLNPPLSAMSLPVRHVRRGANGCGTALCGSEIGVLRRMAVRR